MFYLSPQLTLLMLGIVPPVSLGAVKVLSSAERPNTYKFY